MGFRTTFLSAILLAVTASSAVAQQFQNLNFEQATVVLATGGVPSGADAGPSDPMGALAGFESSGDEMRRWRATVSR